MGYQHCLFTETAENTAEPELLLLNKAGDLNLWVVVEAVSGECAGTQTEGPPGLQAVCGAQGRFQVFRVCGLHSSEWPVKGRTAPPLPLWARVNAAAPAWQDK